MRGRQERTVSEFNDELKQRGFSVFQLAHDKNSTRIYSRKDFYKICLTTGKSVVHYADRSFMADGTVLFFGNPHVPYSWETIATNHIGYTCLFSEDFINGAEHTESLQNSPLFKLGGTPILNISEPQRDFLDLIRNCIQLLIHEALKLQPSENFDRHKNAAARITSVFLELLERQFPIESPDRPLQLRSAQDYARELSIHVNYLNRAVKKTTGKPTTAHIADRVIKEAKALLQHTHWNTADIAYALGFECPTYFNNYFKRLTGTNPGALRACRFENLTHWFDYHYLQRRWLR